MTRSPTLPLDKFEEIACCNCAVRFGVPTGFTASRREDKRLFWCPNGHPQSYRESEADRLRRELERAKQNNAYFQDQVREAREARDRAYEVTAAAERRASAARGQVTKLKRRAANGVCPCCNRSFANLRQHMASQHPQFIAEEIAS